MQIRIIPAYAGCTISSDVAGVSSGDHPRLRGVHISCRPARTTRPGSSPLTRGAPSPWRQGCPCRIRIIPAYAGCTVIRLGFCRTMRGSSPLTRGALSAGKNRMLLSGIIPAYAGCTLSNLNVESVRRDHPRLRGVHVGRVLRGRLGVGSSPLTRGARLPGMRSLGPSRIIPAYAGCTLGTLRDRICSTDHPRLRGVHLLCPESDFVEEGSSPLTRGAPGKLARRSAFRRIIPAYAGCTSHSGQHV